MLFWSEHSLGSPLFQFLELSRRVFSLVSSLGLRTSLKKHLWWGGCSFSGPGATFRSQLSAQPPFSLFPTCHLHKRACVLKWELGDGVLGVPEVILHSDTGFMPPPPDCTCAVEHLLQGDSNMGFSWHPFCWFQKYKLACVGSRLGAALLSSLSFCSFIFHSSCQESLFFQKFLLDSPCPPLSFFFFFPVEIQLCLSWSLSLFLILVYSYAARSFHLCTFISDLEILGQQ